MGWPTYRWIRHARRSSLVAMGIAAARKRYRARSKRSRQDSSESSPPGRLWASRSAASACSYFLCSLLRRTPSVSKVADASAGAEWGAVVETGLTPPAEGVSIRA